MSTLQKYIEQVEQSIENKNGKKLRRLLAFLNQPKAEIRKNFPEPSEIDLYNLKKFGPVVQYYLRATKSALIDHSSIDCFENVNQECINLVRASEQIEGNWIMPVITGCFDDMILLYKVATEKHPEDLNLILVENEINDGLAPKRISRIEKLINTLKSGFNLSNNDKAFDSKSSKRSDVYFFLGNLIKYYFKMGKVELAKSAINSLKGGNKSLPNMTENVRTCKSAIIYLYHQALVSLDDGKYLESEEALNKAMGLIANHKEKVSKQLERLLLILIPLRLYNKGKIPNQTVWQRFPRLKTMYHDNFLDAICQGNLYKFEQCMEKYQVILLKNQLYILMELLRQFVQLRVINKTYKITSELQTGEKSTPISAFKLALELSMYYNEEGGDEAVYVSSHQVSDLEVETIIANLITQGYIRGYVSNTNRVVVFSKSLPFPKITDVKVEGKD
ncbi:Csn12 protein [Candida orthopsilosis Co 90-125]|uniref:Csn12 protein n=1 Tax=Candida orthopsilosis (strain 90-125) TaxID=1136231 RepID=H8X908_CANO9|nr:Csn12 protein [Candida orthopsilosis Co 90-125]CCG24306.1 Csn12 protein [Candida orthopsilosis Co 90-125]